MPNPTPAARRSWQATLIIALFIVAVAAAAVSGWWYARESPPHQGPIVLVSVDALRADRLPAYGSSRHDTPAIDALAADGVVFDRAYTHSPQTLPAHASMLTGQLPFEHGVRDEGGFALADDARTIAEMLRNRGFATGGAVSSFVLRRASGTAQGFSFYDAELPESPADEAAVVERDGVQTFEAAEPWIRSQSGQRYFLFLEVEQDSADAVIGRLVEALKSRQLYDTATIVFTADHGDADSGAALDDSSLRVPLIVKQPDSEGAGRRVTLAVQHIDLVPTLLDLVRAPLPSGLRGRSLRPVLDGKTDTIPDQPIYAESLEALFRFDGQPVFAVTSSGDRLVRGSGEELLRILEDADPDAPPVDVRAGRLRGLLDRLLQGRTVQAPSDITAADADRFAAIGYIPGVRAAAVTPVATAQTTPAETTPTLPPDAGLGTRATNPSTAPIDPAEQAALMDAHRMAMRLVTVKQFSGAVNALRGIVRTQPGLASVHFEIGSLLARSGRLSEAIAAYRTAAALRPDAPDVAMQLATTLVRTGHLDDAKAEAERAVMLAEMSTASQRAAAHEVAARVALAGNDADAAAAHALEAQRADPARPVPQLVRGELLYDEGKYEEALAAFQEADKLLSERGGALADLHLYLGDSLARLDRYPEAETQYREELRAFPENIRTYASLAMLYRASNREQAVEQIIVDLVQAAPTPEGYSMAVKLWTIVGERARADALRADARRRFRGDPSLALLMH